MHYVNFLKGKIPTDVHRRLNLYNTFVHTIRALMKKKIP